LRYSFLVPLVLAFTACLADGQYFPKQSLDAKSPLKNQWYTAQLIALQEPSLFALVKDPTAESYRFLWLRSFQHPVAIRLDPKPDGTSVLTTKISSGAGGFRPGDLTENTSRVLPSEETQKFLLRLNQLKFWSLPNPVNDQRGTDGSQWIIEGVKGGHYHVADRWTPTTGPVHELGELLAFDLARLKIADNEIY
jgi:hypothetical protein